MAILRSPSKPLDRIKLVGYKSIHELEDFQLRPGVNLLIGANGSGKSNFIRFFEMLANMMNPNLGLQNYVRAHGSADAFLFRGFKETREMSAHLWFGLNEYKFTLRGANDRSMFFAQESAPFAGPRYGAIENDQGSGHLESPLAKKRSPTQSEKWVVDAIRDWRLYHFHDTSATAPVMGLCNTVDNEDLHGDASNLSAFLLKLKTEYPDHFARIQETVRQVAPFFGEFALRDERGQTQLLWRDRYSESIYYPHQLSDGTLRYICLATLLLQPNPPSTIIVDEPELGLHPFAIKLLASLLHGASTYVQLIVSTQSSLLLDEFQPRDVIVVNHQNGESEFTRLDASRLASWLEDYTLGQLWEKNELGGLP